MKYRYMLQKNDDKPDDSVKALLAEYLSTGDYDQVYAAMAYVTIAGIRDVLGLMPDVPVCTRWLIGLDDAVSQPGAIELCLSFSNSVVHVASFEQYNRRFHPKILYFTQSTDSHQAFMMLGSPNLTRQAFSGNVESAVFLHAESFDDKKDLDCMWRAAWLLGRTLSDGGLKSYKRKYNQSKKLREKATEARLKQNVQRRSSNPRLVLDSDHAEVDPSTANTCWIECGNVTAMGREIEFKAEQGLFFGLNPHGEAPKHLTFVVSDGTKVSLRMKYQGNHMWRLQMTRNVPEVAQGLRPVLFDGSLGRSHLVAVFDNTRLRDTYVLHFVKLGSKKFRVLRQRSIDSGTYGKTTAREYGWH